jgi:hypothetical protein
MPDNTQKTGGQDRKRININQDYELQDWSDKFGVTKERLKEAVEAVGDSAKQDEKYLKGGEHSSGTSERPGGKGSSR